jgi:hypothetical protein
MERRILNRAIFARIEVGDDGEIKDTTLTPVYQALAAWAPTLGRPCPPAPGAHRDDMADFRPMFGPIHSQNTCKRGKSKPITRLRWQGIVPCIVPQRSSDGRRGLYWGVFVGPAGEPRS